jgi:hypothetical protein
VPKIFALKYEKRTESYKELLTENDSLSSTYFWNGEQSGAKRRYLHATTGRMVYFDGDGGGF